MNYLVYSEQETYPVCLLVPSIRKDEIARHYFTDYGITPDDVLVLTLHQAEGKKKTPMGEMRQYIVEELVPIWKEQGVQYVLCADSDYFKALTKAAKVEANLGYVMDSEYGVKVIYVPNYRAVFYDPDKVKAKIAQGMNALVAHAQGEYEQPGTDIIHFAAYPRQLHEIEGWLVKLLEMNVPLTVDIEAFSLKHHTAGIGTITFCWNKHEGIAFPVDYHEEEWIDEKEGKHYGRNVRNEPVRRMLRAFFEQLIQKAIYHNIAYDAYVLIYQLYMTDILDTEGLLNGMNILLKNWEDTKLISYLATNSCAGNKLGLKDQSQEFTGNYAQDEIKDITKIPLDKLLTYNLVDGLATWYVAEKHYDTMVADNQYSIYETLFKPATLDIIQMQLTGMPLNMHRVLEVEEVLQAICDLSLKRMRDSKIIQSYSYRMVERYIEKMHEKWKTKRTTIDEVLNSTNPKVVEAVTFNPNSNLQLQDLLFNVLEMPVISLTDSKQPSTDGDTITALLNHTKDPDILEFLQALQDYGAVNKILTSFIPAMKNAGLGPDGWHYLFGNFNLGGTVSGRLSSSDPNLQNLPANATMMINAAILARFPMLNAFVKKGKLSLGKIIKYCFQAPPGWMFCGLDFASLEDRISALTTKDPNKLKVYTDGYDGHCLRAHAYFGENMPDIDPDSVASINSIESKYPLFRQDSKAPTFALTYQGTHHTLMKNCGFAKEKAMLVEDRFKVLYSTSIDWVNSKLDQASKDGYITAAFGLRVRTPLLKQVIRGTSKTPYEAEAEGRTAGNALGQSWCLLNSRASAEFMGKVRESKHRLDIRPCAHIHDAQYMLVRDDIDALMFANEHLVKAVQWQDHPDICHDEVKLGGEFGIFYPDWGNEITLPNGATEEEVFSIIEEAMKAA